MSHHPVSIVPSAGVNAIADMSLLTKILSFTPLCVGMFIALLDIQIVSASLKEIGGGLSAGIDEAVWVQTAYLIAEIIVIPLSGWLAHVLSTHWLFCVSAVGFTLASLLCGWAWNIQSMILFRAMQGFLGGAMIPLVFTTAFSFFRGGQRVFAAAIIGGIASLAPTMGPAVGGWITDHYSWHWLFYINILPGTLVAVAVPLLVRIDNPNLSLLHGADYLGMILLALCLGCLEYTLEEGPRWDWFGDSMITATAWISGVSGMLFLWRTLTFVRPIIDLRALKERNFALGCCFSFIAGVGMFTSIYLTPMFLGQVRGFSALQIGEAIFSIGVFQILAIPLYSFFASRFDLRLLLMFGLGGFALSMWSFMPITHDWGTKQLLLPQAFRGLAQQFAVAPVVTLALGSLPPERLKMASGLFNLMRNLGGAIGIAGCATLMNNRTNLHFFRLAESLTGSNGEMNNMLATLTARFEQLGDDSSAASSAALKELWMVTHREALTMAFGDIFLAIMLCFILACALVPFMRRSGKNDTVSTST